MRILTIEHNGIKYVFEYFESTDEILVLKNNVLTYEINRTNRGWECNCPSFKYKRWCWHSYGETIQQIFNRPVEVETWATFAEQAAIERKLQKESNETI